MKNILILIKLQLLISFFISLLTFALIGQNRVSQYPVQISQIQNNEVINNPSLINQKSKFDVSVFSKIYTGLYQNNNLSLFKASTRITPSKSKRYHNLGTYLYYDKEGSFLNRYRGYLQYAYTIKLNEIWNSSFGVAVGVASYKIGNDAYVGGGQANTFDATIGISFWNNNTTLGISALQLPQGKLQPINEISLLKRYFTLNAAKDFELNVNTLWFNNLCLVVYTNNNPALILNSGIKYNNLVSLSVLNKWNKSLGLQFGLEEMKFNESVLKLYISYDINISKSYRNNSAELTIKYGIPFKEKVTKKKR